MSRRPALPCPKCRKELQSLSWTSDDGGKCVRCRAVFEFHGFPALDYRAAPTLPKAVLAAESATCFFHEENQAEAICDSCGRMLCAVCAVPFDHKRMCPSCIARTRSQSKAPSNQRVLHGRIALSVAILPLLFAPITLITAPIALGLVVVGWKKPRSLVTPGPGYLIAAGIIASLEIGAWLVMLAAMIFLRGRR